jgi:hypothetical protein
LIARENLTLWQVMGQLWHPGFAARIFSERYLNMENEAYKRRSSQIVDEWKQLPRIQY